MTRLNSALLCVATLGACGDNSDDGGVCAGDTGCEAASSCPTIAELRREVAATAVSVAGPSAFADTLAATSEGEVVLLEVGVYDASALADVGSVTIRGRCAQDVILGGAGLSELGGEGRELVLQGVTLAARRGLTVTGGSLRLAEVRVVDLVGASPVLTVDSGASVALEAVRLEPPDAELADVIVGTAEIPDRLGSGVEIRSGAVTLRDVLVASPVERGVRVLGGTVELVDTTVASGVWGPDAVALELAGEAVGSVTGGRIVGNGAAPSGEVAPPRGIVVAPGASLSMQGGIVESFGGTGISFDGGAGTLEATEVVGNGRGVTVEARASVRLTDVVVEGTRPGPGAFVGIAVGVRGAGSSVQAAGLEARDNLGPALVVRDGGALTCVQCDLSGNLFAGAWVLDATLELREPSLQGNEEHPDLGGGVGIGAVTSGADVAEPARLTVTGGTIEEHPFAPIYLSGDGTYDFDGVGALPDPPRTFPGLELEVGGHALMAVDGALPYDTALDLGLRLANMRFGAPSGDRPAVFLHAASGLMGKGNAFIGEPTGLQVHQQACDEDIPPVQGDLSAVDAAICVQPGEELLFERLELSLGEP